MGVDCTWFVERQRSDGAWVQVDRWTHAVWRRARLSDLYPQGRLTAAQLRVAESTLLLELDGADPMAQERLRRWVVLRHLPLFDSLAGAGRRHQEPVYPVRGLPADLSAGVLAWGGVWARTHVGKPWDPSDEGRPSWLLLSELLSPKFQQREVPELFMALLQTMAELDRRLDKVRAVFWFG